MRARALLSPVLGVALAASALTLVPGAPAEAKPRDFDLQAHRGGLGLTVESTEASFSKALELGVTTLELDTQVTRDGKVVVTHDRQVSAAKCQDTAPVRVGDPAWPYVGDYVKDLTLAQVRTLECGSLRQPRWPGQELAPGSRMPTLAEVFALVRRYRADDVMLNVETKVEAGAPDETAPRGRFVRAVAREIRTARIGRQVTIQSFDWGSLRLMQRLEPRLPLVALDNIDFLQVGRPGRSPWLGGIDVDDFGGDPVRAIDHLGFDAWSPVQGTPQDGTVGDPGFVPYPTRDSVRRAHRAGLDVIPWTVDDPATMQHLLDVGVDGLITDRPDLLRQVMARNGLRLPRAYRDPRAGRVAPVARAHAHNDYEHDRPLLDALDQGFTSVEADVWLRDGKLLVGHDEVDLVPGRTIERLYLDPLRERVRRNGGHVYRGDDRPVQLLVDLKTEGESTYAALDALLRRYPDVVSQMAPRVRTRAVDVVVSGNRPRETMLAQRSRFAGYDGRLEDLASGYPASFMPLVSQSWTSAFTWTGVGPLPADQQARLDGYVAQAHRAGYRLRFWATPDAAGPGRSALWSVLADRGVDHLNTDDLAGLSAFLTTRDGGHP
ncbi:glycerophosphodiester phosphodiesterase family protein [Solicola sp. PLA-1-18]|uniref:glycerophosphodiester phosphodiesterase family protein n=1 Tax=Solicola sp. PLA-1-18 TaxID=3380532 RepID=UPI003B76485C